MNTQQGLKGYRNLSDDEKELINEGKELAEKVGEFVAKLNSVPSTDKRWLASGKTDLQTGFMKLTRAIAPPTTF